MSGELTIGHAARMGAMGAVAAALMVASGAQAEPGAEHLDPALGGAAATDAASILVSDPSAVATATGPAITGAPIAPATPLRAALADALPAGAQWAQIYEKSGYSPIWLIEKGQNGVDWAKADALLDAAGRADAHGLPSAAYGIDGLRRQIEAARASGAMEDAVAVEIALTKLFLHVGRDYASGALEPRDISRAMDVSPPRPEPLMMLARAMRWEAGSTAAAVEGLAPQTDDYRDLMALYADLKKQRDAGGWGPKVPNGPSLRPFDQGPRVAVMRDRLKAMGFLPRDAEAMIDPDTGDVVFGPYTELAVRDFQTQHGLDVDGIAGAATLTALNVDIEERIGLVAVNLERARWFNFDLGRRHIVVNIAAFEATVMEDGRPIFETDVVVGKPIHPTPEFSDEMTHVVVNPTWHVPYSIATEELLPVLQDNPGALAARGFKVFHTGGGQVDPWSVDWWGLSTSFFPYQLKQGPGPGNALGGVKFIFPNHHAVYLHDTPAKSLFEKVFRAFSHGCVRVADPVGLAEVLIGAQRDDPLGYFYALRENGQETYVTLKRKVPVHLQYRTIWIDDDGVTQVRDDLYGRDALILRALTSLGVSS